MKYYIVKYSDGTYIRSFDTFEQAEMFKVNKGDNTLVIEEVTIQQNKV